MQQPDHPNGSGQDQRADLASDLQRGDLGADLARASAAAATDTLDRDVADPTRANLLLLTEMDSILPTPPRVPGKHFCWLSTDSAYDPLERRLRAGYRLATKEDVPADWRVSGTRVAGDDGHFHVKEMVLAWVPEGAYQAYMLEVHHRRPLQQEEKLRVNVDLLVDKTASHQFKVKEVGSPIGPDVRPAPKHFQSA